MSVGRLFTDGAGLVVMSSPNAAIDERHFSSSCKLHYCGLLDEEEEETYTGELVLRPDNNLCILASAECGAHEAVGSVLQTVRLADLVLEQPDCIGGVVYLRRLSDADDKYIAFSFKDSKEAEELADYLRERGYGSPERFEVPNLPPISAHNVDLCIGLLKDAHEVLAGANARNVISARTCATVDACVAWCLDNDYLASFWRAERNAWQIEQEGSPVFVAKLSELLVRIINIAGRTTVWSLTTVTAVEQYLKYFYNTNSSMTGISPIADGSPSAPLINDTLLAEFLRDLGAGDDYEEPVDDDDHPPPVLSEPPSSAGVNPLKNQAPEATEPPMSSSRPSEEPIHERHSSDKLPSLVQLDLKRNLPTMEGADPFAILLSEQHFEGCLRVLETSPLGHQRADFLTYWREEIQFHGDHLLESCVKDPERRELVRMASLLAARVMYLRDVVLPRFLEDYVLQHATIIATALETFIWSCITQPEGLSRITETLTECSDEEAVVSMMQMIISFQRMLKPLPITSLRELFAPLVSAPLLKSLWGWLVESTKPSAVAACAGELLYFSAAIHGEAIIPVMLQDASIVDLIFATLTPDFFKEDLATVSYVADVIKFLFKDATGNTRADSLALNLQRSRTIARLIIGSEEPSREFSIDSDAEEESDEIPRSRSVERSTKSPLSDEPNLRDERLESVRQMLSMKAVLLSLLKDGIMNDGLAAAASSAVNLNQLLENNRNFSLEVLKISAYYYVNSKKFRIGISATSLMSQAVKFVRAVEFGPTSFGTGFAGDSLEYLLQIVDTEKPKGAIEACILSLIKTVSMKAAKCRQTSKMLKNLLLRNKQLINNLHNYYSTEHRLDLFKEWLQITEGGAGSLSDSNFQRQFSASSPSLSISPINGSNRSPYKRTSPCGGSAIDASPAKRTRSSIEDHDSIIAMLGVSLDLGSSNGSAGNRTDDEDEFKISVPIVARPQSKPHQASLTIKLG